MVYERVMSHGCGYECMFCGTKMRKKNRHALRTGRIDWKKERKRGKRESESKGEKEGKR